MIKCNLHYNFNVIVLKDVLVRLLMWFMSVIGEKACGLKKHRNQMSK